MEKSVTSSKDNKRPRPENFLQTLDFVESVTQYGMSRKGRQVKILPILFHGRLWTGREYFRQESIRKEAWATVNIIL